MLIRSTRLSAVVPVLLALTVLTACSGTGSTEPAAVVTSEAGTATSAGTSSSEAPGSPAPMQAEVLTVGLQFVPAEISVKAGGTVTWRNTDGIPHTVTSGTYEVGPGGERTSENPDGRFDYRLAGEGATVSHTFAEPGTYFYFCRPHGGMNGKVVVEP